MSAQKESDRLEALKFINEIEEEMEARIQFLEGCMKYHSGLIKYNMIVEVGAYTVASVNGKMELQMTAKNIQPNQFSREGVAEIKSKIKYLNMREEPMEFKEISHIEWYAKELKLAKNTLKQISESRKLQE
jgi:hypothetical protein